MLLWRRIYSIKVDFIAFYTNPKKKLAAGGCSYVFGLYHKIILYWILYTRTYWTPERIYKHRAVYKKINRGKEMGSLKSKSD